MNNASYNNNLDLCRLDWMINFAGFEYMKYCFFANAGIPLYYIIIY